MKWATAALLLSPSAHGQSALPAATHTAALPGRDMDQPDAANLPLAASNDGALGLESRDSPAGLGGRGQAVLQETPVRREAHSAPWETGVLFQGGLGLTENREGFRFLLAGAHLGKVITSELGTGILRGNFEYAGELFPYVQAFTPKFQRLSCNADPGATVYTCAGPYTAGGTYTGLSVTPIILRWNFTHGEHWMPWVQGAGGVLWTNHKFPAIGNTNPLDLSSNGIHGDASVWNFTPQFGIGTHLFVRPRRSVDLSANAVHISSASLGDRNPGVNASVQFAVGYTWWK